MITDYNLQIEDILDKKKLHGTLAATWGIAGFSLLIMSAIFRLGDIALDIRNYDLSAVQWLVLLASILFMAYSEGYKGFQLKFSPRFAARCLYLKQNPRLMHSLLAPLFCMGFFYTTRRRKITSSILAVAIIGFILIAHQLTQPWRGILDAGVVVGLGWGMVSLIYFMQQAFTDPGFDYSPELPD